jgi:uncharacterized protein
MENSMIVRCPACGRRGTWLAGAYKPFCSERCKLVDMGKWFEGEYRISEPLRPEHFEQFAELAGEEADLDRPESEEL